MRQNYMTAAVAVMCAATCLGGIDLNGTWEFRFEEGMTLETSSGADFAATDSMSVPGCYDMQPKWLCKRGTGLYRRTFSLEKAVEDAWIVVDGMGLRAKFAIDGKQVGGVQPYPWARLEIPTGPLEAGEHTIFAALDNVLDWKTQKLALPYYDFYLYGGFYHGVSLSLDNRKLFVRTRDYKTGTVEIEAVNFKERDFAGKLVFDCTNEVDAVFKEGRTTVKVPDFKLWSPNSPKLHTVSYRGEVSARFGIREIKAEKKRLWLNGEVLFLKGANRHEAHPQFGAATPEALMVQDIQLLKSLNGNFFRGSHYQQSQRFLDYCDEMGVLVWEESLGWGNNPRQMSDGEYFRLQVEQTREMVRASFNHPSVIIFAFQNENQSQTKAGKKLNDALIEAIRSQDSGRLVTFACNHNDNDISNANTDLVSFNTYPGWIGSDAGTLENQKRLIDETVTKIVRRYRTLYPEKPIIASEMGTVAIYGHHDPAAGQGTEEFQYHYDKDVIDRIFADPELSGLALWHFADARTYHRGGSAIRVKLLAENMAGLYDGYRRAKMVTQVVREGFSRKAAGEQFLSFGGTDSGSMTFMTFNIWGDYFENPVEEREAGVEATILKSRPDVVTLQEVTPNWYRSPMFSNLEKAGYAIVRGDENAALMRAAFSGERTKKHINHEPMLFRRDRLKLLDSGTEFFHLSLQTSKSVTWAVLEEKASGMRFAALGTHFWWQSNGNESDTIRELNARHVLWILADIRRKWGEGLPAILGGDLNSTETSIAHAMLRSGGFMNAASNADVRSPHCSHHGNPRRGTDGKYHGSLRPAEYDTPDHSIDHIFYTKGIRALRHEICTDQTALDASDHSPVLLVYMMAK